MAEFTVRALGFVETWTINGEARRNALSRAVVAELAAQVQRVRSAPQVRAVVITGAGSKAFCAGADLKERAGMSQAEVRAFLHALRAAFRAIERADQVFVAYLNGAALGGGTELALACDLRVAHPSAELGLTEVTLGIIPGGGGTQRLPRLVGPGVAKELILTGRRLGAAEALQRGLINRVGTLEEAEALATTVAGNAPIAVAAAKRAIDDGAGLDLEAALALEQQLYARTLDTEDRTEGLRAFQEKRAPVYQGR